MSLFLLASMVLVGGAPFVAVVKGPVALGHLASSWTMGLLWLLARRSRLSLRSLAALDAIGSVVAWAGVADRATGKAKGVAHK